MEKILILGAGGQLGFDLSLALQEEFGINNVVVSDIKPVNNEISQGIVETVDVLNPDHIIKVIEKYKITQIYHLAAILSAVGEKKPKLAWEVNFNGLLNVLEVSKNYRIKKVFWPSSIAVFGPETPKKFTPQNPFMNPNTVYGISKLAGERWCEYYFNKHNLDVRSVRYPGLIGYKSLPGGGTTDYAVEIFHKAVKGEEFVCFLKKDTCLPMMYIPDAVAATLRIMEGPGENLRIRSSYNISGLSISPEEIAASIIKHIPGFKIKYDPDFRQQIADTWPQSIDDKPAQEDWGWKPSYTLEKMTIDMLSHLSDEK